MIERWGSTSVRPQLLLWILGVFESHWCREFNSLIDVDLQFYIHWSCFPSTVHAAARVSNSHRGNMDQTWSIVVMVAMLYNIYRRINIGSILLTHVWTLDVILEWNIQLRKATNLRMRHRNIWWLPIAKPTNQGSLIKINGAFDE